VRGSDLVNCPILDPLILPFSRREKGRTVCSDGVESHVPDELITGKVVHSERLTDSSTDLYGTVVNLTGKT